MNVILAKLIGTAVGTAGGALLINEMVFGSDDLFSLSKDQIRNRTLISFAAATCGGIIVAMILARGR